MKGGQIIQFPLARGLGEDGNPKAQPMATLKSGHNVRWPKDGVLGKRWAGRALPSPPIAPVRIVSRGATLAVTDGAELATYDPVTEDWTTTPNQSPVELSWSTVIDDTSGVANCDVAASGDYLVIAWVTGDPTRTPEDPLPNGSGRVFVQVVHRTTGQIAMAARRVLSPNGSWSDHVRVLVAGGYAFIIASSEDWIDVQPINLTTYAWSAAATLRSDRMRDVSTEQEGRFDAMFLASGDLVLVYERNTVGTSDLSAARFTRTADTFALADQEDHGDGSPYVNATAIAIEEDPTNSRVYVLYGQIEEATSEPRVRLFAVSNTAMTVSLAVATVRGDFFASQTALSLVSAGTILVMYSGFQEDTVGISVSRVPAMWSHLYTDGSSVTDTRRRSMGLGLCSRIFLLGSQRHVVACDGRDGDDQGVSNQRIHYPSTMLIAVDHDVYDSTTLIEEPPHRLVGKVDHDIGAIFQLGRIPSVVSVDSDNALALVPFQADAAQADAAWRTGLRLVTMTIDPAQMADPWRSVHIGGETYIKGGVLAAWDGSSVFDYGMRAPILLSTTGQGANTGNMTNGAYAYQVASSYRSRAGVLHRSPMSPQSEAPAVVDTDSVQVEICTHGVDGKQSIDSGIGEYGASCVFMDVFRTTANGSILYQLTMPPRFNPIVNNPTDDVTVFTDTHPDSSINDSGGFSIELESRPQPYTASGELEDCQPPGQYTIHLHGGRIFLVTGGRREVWFSKDFRENPGIAPGFNVAQLELYEQPLTAIASMDEKRIMFHEEGLYYVVGDGPNVTGLDNRFSAPIKVQSDVGCTNPRSVVSWPGGIIFQSGTDLHNLSRGLEVSWFGREARGTLTSYPVITSAVLVPEENELRFTCNAADGLTSIILVRDYVRGTWSTRSYRVDGDALGDGAITDAALIDGVYYWAQGGLVFYEDTSTHLDLDISDGEEAFVESTVELEPISPSGPIGWQRVRVLKLLGQSLSNHSLSVRVSRDWATSYEQNESFAAGTDATTPGPHARVEVALEVQRRQAVGLKFTDGAPANAVTHPLGDGAGFQFEGVALLVKPQQGLPRDTPSRRGG